MAIPIYTFLNKVKMSGPNIVITIGTSFWCTHQCEQDSCELTLSIVASTELIGIRKELVKVFPNSNKAMKYGGYKSLEYTKVV